MEPAGRSGPRSSAAPPSPMPQEADDLGLQARPMGLKVHYTFDKDSQVHCLARWPHILQLQSIPLDEKNAIGVIDLRTCLLAIAQCSPEIVTQPENDYTVYAFDYSEPDTPLVGQGMLSWGLDPNSDPQSQQLVTGRVTRSLLAIFGNGARETLEVKLKLNAVPKMQRADGSNINTDPQNTRSAPTPVDTTNSEWNSFIQANPALGRSASVAGVPSPSLGPIGFDNFALEHAFPDIRSDCLPSQPNRPPSIAPAAPKFPPHERPASQPSVDTAPEKPPRASRPSSRASRKAPTGRPRGRPRKKPVETGHTSAAEEVTDADDGPNRKRAKVTKVDHSSAAPFGSTSDSLRVAASTSGSLRNMRPLAIAGGAPPAGHLQDIPRAPTPIPTAPILQGKQRKQAPPMNARRGSTADFENSGPYQPHFNQQSQQTNRSQDARSPTQSIAHSPDQGYTPESAADIGSSPPVPRASAYMQSSPMPSSPVLPHLPVAPVDSGFMSGGMDDFFDEEDLPQELPRQESKPDLFLGLPLSQSSKQPPAQKGRNPQPQNFPFQEVNPGPPEFLPVTSIFNPAGRAKSLNRAVAPKKPVSRTLERSSMTTSCPPRPELEPTQQEQPALPETIDNRPASQPAAAPRQLDVSFMSLDKAASMSQASFDIPQPKEGSAATSSKESPPNAEPPATTSEPSPAASAPKEPKRSPSLASPRLAPRSATAAPAVPASDPAPEMAISGTLTLPQVSYSEALGPPTDSGEPPKFNKNYVKKQSIKERLESAIQRGEMPPFCNNCGAIETPTWRKIWTQDHKGIPGFHEFSDKPGHVTTIDILERNAEGQPTMHRLIKKNLGPADNRGDWSESLLCNPCGIWLTKFKSHRPPDRWDKDAARLNQPRRKRESKSGNSRAKKPRTKSDGQLNPTSEAYFTTDPFGPGDHASPNETEGGEADSRSLRQNTAGSDGNDDQNQLPQPGPAQIPKLLGSPNGKRPGSTHSRGSGTADSPIAVEDDLGVTRRLLFPSPRKDGVAKILGELAVNVVRTGPNLPISKSTTTGKKENVSPDGSTTPRPPAGDDLDLDHQLFGTPPARPSTPPPVASSGPFKTPTRPTPSHRPITRSISRSIRSAKSIPRSPGQAFMPLQRTPSKTPRSTGSNALNLSSGKRRSPRHANLHAHFAISDDGHAQAHFYSPFTATLNQLLSEANGFTAGSPSHGLAGFELGPLPNLDSDDVQHLADAGPLDFGNFLSTDMVMPSSPPLLRNHAMDFGGALNGPAHGSDL